MRLCWCSWDLPRGLQAQCRASSVLSSTLVGPLLFCVFVFTLYYRQIPIQNVSIRVHIQIQIQNPYIKDKIVWWSLTNQLQRLSIHDQLCCVHILMLPSLFWSKSEIPYFYKYFSVYLQKRRTCFPPSQYHIFKLNINSLMSSYIQCLPFHLSRRWYMFFGRLFDSRCK